MNIFGGYEDFMDILWGLSQNRVSIRVISMHFRVFFKVKVKNWDIFWGCKNFKYFFGVLEIPDIFWGLKVDAGSESTYVEKIREPAPLGKSYAWHLFLLQ